MAKVHSQIESHNSLLTNREMAILSSQIDMLAFNACQSMHYQNIQAYFNMAELYYFKLRALIDKDDQSIIESVRESYYKLSRLIDNYPACQTKRSLQLLLQITKDFYFKVRDGLQKSKYYFRVMQVKEKGLGSISFYDTEAEDDVESSNN
jgi:hypothetical protein